MQVYKKNYLLKIKVREKIEYPIWDSLRNGNYKNECMKTVPNFKHFINRGINGMVIFYIYIYLLFLLDK